MLSNINSLKKIAAVTSTATFIIHQTQMRIFYVTPLPSHYITSAKIYETLQHASNARKKPSHTSPKRIVVTPIKTSHVITAFASDNRATTINPSLCPRASSKISIKAHARPGRGSK